MMRLTIIALLALLIASPTPILAAPQPVKPHTRLISRGFKPSPAPFNTVQCSVSHRSPIQWEWELHIGRPFDANGCKAVEQEFRSVAYANRRSGVTEFKCLNDNGMTYLRVMVNHPNDINSWLQSSYPMIDWYGRGGYGVCDVWVTA